MFQHTSANFFCTLYLIRLLFYASISFIDIHVGATQGFVKEADEGSRPHSCISGSYWPKKPVDGNQGG